jgi:3'-phosphoadenosine 5'-phosphosulfate sulfotransferase (PAPS reductase)/FAD synthetase
MFFLLQSLFDKTGADPILTFLKENGFDTEVADINTHKALLKVDNCRYAYFEYHQDEEFKEVLDYCSEIEKDYGINIEKYEGKIKVDLEQLVNNEDITTILIGNRRTDPYSDKLKHVDQSSEGWPDFTRIHPLLDWDYPEVWQFINFFKFKIC